MVSLRTILRSQRRVAPLVIALLLGWITACGSTVPQAAGQAESVAGAEAGLDGGGTAVTSSSSSELAGGATAQPGTAPIGEPAPQSAVGVARPVPGRSAGTVTSAKSGPAAPVEVGVFAPSNTAAFYAAVGVKATATNDRAQTQAVIDYLNAHGGLGGHRIDPIYAFDDLTSSQSHASQGEAACANWTQDHHVIAVVSYYITTDAMNACLADHSVANFVMGHYEYTASDFARYSWVAPSTMNANRFAAIYVDQLAQQNYFAGKPTAPSKIGVLYLENGGIDGVRLHSLYPALARHGLKVTDAAGISYPQREADISSAEAEVQSAMLRFHADGINHVLLLDESGGLYLVAALNAEDQHYYPRWGLSTYDNPGSLEADIPADQEAGAMGVGYSPSGDVDPNHQPPSSSTAKLCDKIMTAAGQPTTDGAGWLYCDPLFLLQAATKGISSASLATAALARPALLRGVDVLGATFQPANTFADSFSAKQHDGPMIVRRFAFADSCGCFVYTSGPIHAG